MLRPIHDWGAWWVALRLALRGDEVESVVSRVWAFREASSPTSKFGRGGGLVGCGDSSPATRYPLASGFSCPAACWNRLSAAWALASSHSFCSRNATAVPLSRVPTATRVSRADPGSQRSDKARSNDAPVWEACVLTTRSIDGSGLSLPWVLRCLRATARSDAWAAGCGMPG